MTEEVIYPRYVAKAVSPELVTDRWKEFPFAAWRQPARNGLWTCLAFCRTQEEADEAVAVDRLAYLPPS